MPTPGVPNTAGTSGTWVQPFTAPYPQIQPSYPLTTTTYPTIVNTVSQDYANDVEVELGEYDAVLRFYRKRKAQRTLVKELIVPLALLEQMNMPNKKRGK